MTLEEIQEEKSSKLDDHLEVGGEGEGCLGDDSPWSGLGDEVDVGPLLFCAFFFCEKKNTEKEASFRGR